MQLKTLFAILILSGLAYADGGCVHDIALQNRTAGVRVVANASVRVCTDVNCLVLASIYTDPTLGTPLSNPLTADSNGNYNWCAASGTYHERISNPADGTIYFKHNVGANAVVPALATLATTALSANKDAVGDKAFYNAVSDCGVSTVLAADVGAALNACFAAHPGHKFTFPKIQAVGACDYSTSVTLVPYGEGVILEGEGRNVRICMLADQPGIFLRADSPYQAYRPEVRHLSLIGQFPWTSGTNLAQFVLAATYGGAGSNNDGIQVATDHAVLEDIYIQGFPRHGVAVGNGWAWFANIIADHWTFKRVEAQWNRGSGFAVWGNDANVGHCDMCDSRNNQLWGFDEPGTLGNKYTMTHSAGNHNDLTAGGSSVNLSTSSQVQTPLGALTTLVFASNINASKDNWIVCTGLTHVTGVNTTRWVRSAPAANSVTIWNTAATGTVVVGAETGSCALTQGSAIWVAAGADGGCYKNSGLAGHTIYETPYCEIGGPDSKINTTATTTFGGQGLIQDANSSFQGSRIDSTWATLPFGLIGTTDGTNLYKTKIGLTTASNVTFLWRFFDFQDSQIHNWTWFASGTFSMTDSNGKIRFQYGGGTNAVTDINSAGISPIRLNDLAGSTGGTSFYDGGGTPAVVGTVSSAGLAKFATHGTNTNCSSSGGTCAAAAAGSVSIAAAATTVTVATTAVTASSQVFVQEDSSLGTKLSVTCNTTTGRTYTVTTRTAATSFVITSSAAPVTNPACLSYFIVN